MLCVGLLIMYCTTQSPPVPSVYCPPLVQYDRNTQSAVSAELKKLPANSPVGRMIADYGTLRAKCRAIKG
jgi:hypothetical protein